MEYAGSRAACWQPIELKMQQFLDEFILRVFHSQSPPTGNAHGQLEIVCCAHRYIRDLARISSHHDLSL